MLVTAALVATGCAQTPPPKQAASITPKLVSQPTPKGCSAETLANVTPWVGRITDREPIEAMGDTSTIVRNDWVLCSGLDVEDCEAWARRTAERSAASNDLTIDVSPGKSYRGKLWTIDVGDHEEAHLFPSNREFVAYFRSLEHEGKKPIVLGSDRVVEARYNRVEIAYRTPPGYGTVPAARWRYEIPKVPSAIAEASLAFEDLEADGIGLTSASWVALHEAAWKSVKEGRVPELATDTSLPPTDEVFDMWLEVHCGTP